jgi:membrane protein implicated in regulation of membrane protease activity
VSQVAIGSVGRVVVRIRGGELPGEVQLRVQGSPDGWIAYADEEVPVGAEVLVVGSRGGRRIDVVPWHIALPANDDDLRT